MATAQVLDCVVKIPVGVNLLRCHFVFKIKFKNGKVDRLKSRLVVDGSQQHKGVDYSDTLFLLLSTQHSDFL